MSKPREWWIGAELKNQFVCPRKEHDGPEFTGHIRVIEFSAYQALKLQCEKLASASLSFYVASARSWGLRPSDIEQQSAMGRLRDALAEYQAFKEKK